MEILRQLHTSVAQTFETSFDDAYQRLNSELAVCDARVKKAEEKVKLANDTQIITTTRAGELEYENSVLRDELSSFEIDPKIVDFYDCIEEKYAPRNIPELYERDGVEGDEPDTKEQNKALRMKYKDLYRETRTLLETSGKLRKQIKKQKQKLEQWQGFLNGEEFSTTLLDGTSVKFRRLHGTNSKNRVQLSDSEPRFSVLEPSSSVGQKKGVETLTAGPHLAQSSSDTTIHKPKAKTEISNGNRQVQLLYTESDLISTQSTASSESEEAISTDHPSGASIVPVPRTLKRKRSSSPEFASQNGALETGRSEEPVVIKSKDLSSSPLQNPWQYCVPTGTQNLDDIGSTVETPRKKKGSGFDQHHAGAFTGSGSVPIRGPQQNHRNDRQYASDKGLSQHTTLLQPIDSNLRTANYPGSRADMKPKRNMERVTRHAIPLIAEDGDESCPGAKAIKKLDKSLSNSMDQAISSVTGRPVQSRLLDLLERPLPSKPPLKIPKIPGVSIDFGGQRLRASAPVSPEKTTTTTTTTWTCAADASDSASKMKSPQERQNTPQQFADNTLGRHSDDRDGRSDVRSNDQPYRTLPRHRLKLSHFKINSENNQGLDFAFDTVVRRKDERKFVSGCTRPDCCGDKFRAMVRLGGLPTRANGYCQDEKDQMILEDYMGDEKNLIHKSSVREREDLLQEAKAKRLANDFGKHRHNHQRPRTPPGFWRADMPSTQELDDDHEEAHKLESERIMERYKEATRPEGLWKFADE
ncbi:hypothetical protein MW887_008415 [Aspergillus wentii]|nr:hypothetical protein MW887_008415 [Aspergillus wentii]